MAVKERAKRADGFVRNT